MNQNFVDKTGTSIYNQVMDKIIEKTKRDYNMIADHFSETRHAPWKEFEFLFENIPEGAKVLDLGCGNGRFYPVFKRMKVNYIGVDKSEKLVEKALEKYPEGNFIVADALDLPFKNDFDFIFSIAVFHHIPGRHNRKIFLKQIEKSLKRGGKVRMSVWDLMKCKKGLLFKNIKDKMMGRLGMKDALIPWKNSGGETITKRYYHFFTRGELRKLFSDCNLELEKIFKKGESVKSNIFIFAKKND